MTLANQQSTVTAEGNGATTSWTFTFIIPTEATCRLQVYDTTVDPATVTDVATGSFTITGLNDPDGGVVTYPLSGSALVSGQFLTISRVLPIVQDTSIRNQGNFYPAAVERALDYLTMICQQLASAIEAIQDEIDNPIPPVVPVDPVLPFINLGDYDPAGDGVTDDTQAFYNAASALGGTGGTIFIPKPTASYAINLVITASMSGITWIGPGLAKNQTVPLGNYFKPFNNALPVLQVGNDTGYVTGCVFDGWCLYGAGTGQVGLSLKGGAYRNNFLNFQAINFTQRQVELTAGALYPVAYNKLFGLQANCSTIAGADGVYFTEVAGSYNAANSIDSFDISGNVTGHALVSDSAATNMLSNGWIQTSTGAGLLFLHNGATLPYFIVSNVEVDSDTGTDLLLESRVADLQGASLGQTLIYGQISLDGKNFFTDTSTTGTINSGSPTLTVASATDVWAGRSVVITGAGTAGGPFVATILNVSGTTVTLDANAITSVIGAGVYVGDLTADTVVGTRQNYLALTAMRFNSEADVTQPSPEALVPQLLTPSGVGSVAPYNGTSPVFELGTKDFVLMMTNGFSPGTITASRSGTIVSVQCQNAHGMRVGSPFTMNGALEQGIGGFFTAATVTDSTHFTYSSSISGTITAAAGSLAVLVYSPVKFSDGSVYVSDGIYFFDAAANATKSIYNSPTNANFFINTPNVTAGTFVFSAGSTSDSSARYLFGAGGNFRFNINGWGNPGIGGNSPQTASQTLHFAKATATPTSTSSGGSIYCSSNGSLYAIDANGAVNKIST